MPIVANFDLFYRDYMDFLTEERNGKKGIGFFDFVTGRY